MAVISLAVSSRSILNPWPEAVVVIPVSPVIANVCEFKSTEPVPLSPLKSKSSCVIKPVTNVCIWSAVARFVPPSTIASVLTKRLSQLPPLYIFNKFVLVSNHTLPVPGLDGAELSVCILAFKSSFWFKSMLCKNGTALVVLFN